MPMLPQVKADSASDIMGGSFHLAGAIIDAAGKS